MLKVSKNRRYLVRADGKAAAETPFFYLGDTAWELFHRLDRDEAAEYLRRRAAQKFTVVQAVALAEFDGLTEPNRYGDLPLHDEDPARPNDAYFRHIDFIVDTAASLGLFVGLLPSWGDKVNPKWAKNSRVIFSPENARAYGEFLGRRYREKPIIWIVGGDRPVETPEHAAVWRAIAAGLKAGDGGRHLMTFHPMGWQSSADFFHNDDWLDFNMLQSGHSKQDAANYTLIARDYARMPVKPCMDAEPCYEDHPINWDPKNGWFDDWDVRKAAYWAVFAGAHGHTYGCQDIWQFQDTKRHPPIAHARTPWREALDLPGANQMQYLRFLMSSRPFLSRIPDQSLLASPEGEGARHVRATRNDNGEYALIYSPMGEPFSVHLNRLSGSRVRANWFDPRTGKMSDRSEYDTAKGTTEFTPPSSGPGNDWVLSLVDARRGYALVPAGEG